MTIDIPHHSKYIHTGRSEGAYLHLFVSMQWLDNSYDLFLVFTQITHIMYANVTTVNYIYTFDI